MSLSSLDLREEARAALQEALHAIEHDRSSEMAATRVTAARQFEALGDLDTAEQGYVAAVDEFRRRGDRWILPLSLTYLADLRTRRGEPERAIPLYEEAMTFRKANDDILGVATCVGGLGVARLRMGDPETARQALREAVRLYDDWDSGVARCLVPLAQAEAAVGSRKVALRLALRAVRMLRGMTSSTRYSIGPEGERLLPDAECLVNELTGE